MSNEEEKPIEFEYDAPIEIPSDSELEAASKNEVGKPSESLDKVFKADKIAKEKRDKLVKKKKPALKIHKKAPTVKKMKENYKPKDYIVVECRLCEHEYTHAKKDDKGAFIPFALCNHIVFKGVVVEE